MSSAQAYRRTPDVSPPLDPQALATAGELFGLIEAHDWPAGLGPPERWPSTLRTLVRVMLASRQPQAIWWGPDLIQIYNDAFRRTFAAGRHPSALGSRAQDAWSDIWSALGPQAASVMRGEGATWTESQRLPMIHNGVREDHWWTYGLSPINDEDGVAGVLVAVTEVTTEHAINVALTAAQKSLQDENVALHKTQDWHHLLAGELHHRVKNVLATVLAMARLSLRDATSLEAFLESYSARIGAMSATHDLIHTGGVVPGRVEVCDLLHVELRPYLGPHSQVTINCETASVAADVATNLGLIVHELSTNAVKYGALAHPEGRLDIVCRAHPAGAILSWREVAGRKLPPRGPSGFGSRLLSRLGGVLGGSAELDLRDTGMEATLVFEVAPPLPSTPTEACSRSLDLPQASSFARR